MNIRFFWVFVLVWFSVTLTAQVLPHPLKADGIPPELIGEDFVSPPLVRNARGSIDLTNNVLVLRVDFPDHPFDMTESFPAFHPQNEEYFRKYMEHVKNFYLDASGGQYELKYFIAPEVYTMQNNLEWYGDDSFESRRRPLIVAEVVEQIGDSLPFRDFEALIIFHSGAGQESDIYGLQKQALFSTFMSIATFRNVFDPDNLDYEGIPTADGSFITKVALMASSQYHPYFPEEPSFHFEILGVLATQYGRIMGLPTLFGNVSAFGQHAGTGNYCIMGTGTWNNDGKTPPLPSAWVRYFAGWETPVEIAHNAESIQIAFPMTQSVSIAHTEWTISNTQIGKLFKVNISEKEYFLIENRQHNFIKDEVLNIDTGEWRPTINHSFELLPDDEQDFVYSVLRDGSGTIRVPMVNLMKNNLRGSEWDFFLPWTIAGNPNSYHDPSGLLIWHIDEYVIDQRIGGNVINADPQHRGVSLKEADGIQHMASSMPHYYYRGGPFKAYRADNNAYIGYQVNPATGFYAIPSAESYYGGVNFEIYDIGYSEDIMSFSVRFEPWSEAEFFYENFLEPFVFDFDKNGINEVHYFHADGYMTVFENHQKLKTIWLDADTLAFNYTFDGEKKLVIPAQDKYFQTKAKLQSWDGNRLNEVWQLDDWFWANSPVYIDIDWQINGEYAKWIFSLKTEVLGERVSRIDILDENFSEIETFTYQGNISNVVYSHSQLRFINDVMGDSPHLITIYRNDHYVDKDRICSDEFELEGIWRIYQGDFLGKGNNAFFIHYQHLDINRFFVWEEYYDSIAFDSASGGGPREVTLHFPFSMTGQPVFKDITKNGIADIILSHANGFSVFTITGSLIRQVVIDNPDLAEQGGSGLIAWSWANSNDVYFIGGFSKNRLMFFDSDFRVISSLTRTLGHPMQTLPYISTQDGNMFLYQATDKGRIYNNHLVQAQNTEKLGWNLTLGNYYRNAFWQDELENSFAGVKGTFVNAKNYVFPSPWINRHHTHLRFNVMTTADTSVEISIYNISGQLIAQMTDNFIAFEENRDRFVFNPDRWSSGMYFAILKAQNDSLSIKFAIER